MTAAQRRSLWALALLFAYYAIDRWLPLGAWNGSFNFPVDNPQAILDIIVLVVIAGSFAAVRYQIWPGMIAGTGLLGLWCYFHVTTWWLPYVRGVDTASELRFHEQLSSNLQLLPRWGTHIPPDGEHIAIDVFVFAATVSTAIATVIATARGLRRLRAR
jgi:hypothetical protein